MSWDENIPNWRTCGVILSLFHLHHAQPSLQRIILGGFGQFWSVHPKFCCLSSMAKARSWLWVLPDPALWVSKAGSKGFPGTIPISWSAGSKLALQQRFGTFWCCLWKTGGEERDFNHWTSTNWHGLCPNWERARIWLWTFQEEKNLDFPTLL